MVRKRNDLCITAPNFFRCPISLDVMKSPVSLCTGVTYDRSSIQRWLDGGNNTCPATMQVLQSKDLVPNHTLQRLIQIWSDSSRTRSPATESTAVNSVTQAEAKSIIQQLKSNLLLPPGSHGENISGFISISLQCMGRLILFAKQSEENSNFLSSAGSELLPALVSKFSKLPMQIQASEKVFQLSYLLFKNHKSALEQQEIIIDDKFVAAMLNFLQLGSREFRISVAKLLKIIANLSSEKRHLLGENDDVYRDLLRLMISSEWDQEAMESCLSCLLTISMPKKNRLRLVRGGAVVVLSKALDEAELSVGSTEKVLKLLEIVSTCKEGRVEICGNEKCVEAIVKKVLKVSTLATEHSVTILWSLCCLFRDQRAQEAVTKSNGMAKILLLMQSNVSGAVRQMCSDLLKVFRVQSRNSCLSSYDTKTTHIMPF
ncbi:unnamed protein product [Coffea canephora]|uniref:U-box domain-containing protein n=1 Tax=Coffea canephora TaxID=49390 RepID=A0A068U918_COFCA|nr:unnamed protein product [Coffea canephora]